MNHAFQNQLSIKNHMKKSRFSPGRVIALGFLSVILIGAFLLSLPAAHSGKVDVSPLDALFSATSAVCVTGLITVDTGAAYSLFGQIVIAILLQIGGLGITTLGAGLIALMGGRLNQRENNLVKEALNYPTWDGVKPLIRAVVLLDFSIEAIGAVLSFFVFVQDFPLPKAIWYSVFHAVAAFNNGGFDVLGNGDSVGVYTHNIYFNLVTCALIVLGGLGFFVMRELIQHKKGERFSLHTKVVLMLTAGLVFGGMLAVKLTEGDGITWIGALFASVTARTAGFATYPMGGFSNAGIIVMCVLMFIGASPGSTGGGVKTTTFYALIKSLISTSTGREARSFGKKLRDDTMHRAFIIVSLAFAWVLVQTTVMSVFDPAVPIRDLLFEMVSGFSTTGLTMGITPTLSIPSKLILIITMYVGRLGPLTIATLWKTEKRPDVSRPEEDLPIG
ncbi:MAG: H(+)-transporting ATPase [Clostridia bacterium]|nr:H(+)-transporting ATPase [Clostridia bacterium]